MAESVKRTYVSTKREAQARATRSAIVAAAIDRFTTNGYTATTMQAIADAAGVAVQTVYATFGNKREVLRQALEAAVAGDGVAGQRPIAQEIRAEPDARRRVEMAAALATATGQRVAPIVQVIREAASVDTEFAATWDAIMAVRRTDMRDTARMLAGPGGLRVPLEEAIGTLLILHNPEVFTSLTADMGWSVKRFERWLADMMYRTLLLE